MSNVSGAEPSCEKGFLWFSEAEDQMHHRRARRNELLPSPILTFGLPCGVEDPLHQRLLDKVPLLPFSQV